jgi:hypothetical protein
MAIDVNRFVDCSSFKTCFELFIMFLRITIGPAYQEPIFQIMFLERGEDLLPLGFIARKPELGPIVPKVFNL